jgi:hypothetical protein
MTVTTQTVRAEVLKARSAVTNGQTLFAFELRLDAPVEGLDSFERYQLSVYANYLSGRHALPRMALVSEGETLTLELEGLAVRDGFIEYDRIVDFTATKPGGTAWM